MPRKDLEKERILEKYLDKATVQLNVRIPIRLQARLDEFMDYMDIAPSERSLESQNWPSSRAGVVVQALEDFFTTHPRKLRTGPPASEVIIKKPMKLKPKTQTKTKKNNQT